MTHRPNGAGDDNALPICGLRAKVRCRGWATLSKHNWSSFGERRGFAMSQSHHSHLTSLTKRNMPRSTPAAQATTTPKLTAPRTTRNIKNVHSTSPTSRGCSNLPSRKHGKTATRSIPNIMEKVLSGFRDRLSTKAAHRTTAQKIRPMVTDDVVRVEVVFLHIFSLRPPPPSSPLRKGN